MANLTNNAEGGVNGATVATTDTGSGDSWTLVNAGASDSVCQYTTVDKINGTKSYRFATRATGAAVNLIWDLGTIASVGATLDTYHRFYFMVDATPTADTVLAIVASHNGVAGAGQLLLTASGSGVLRLRNSNGSTTAYTFTTVPTPGTWYRIGIHVTANGTDQVCNWQVRLHVGNNSTVIEDSGVIAVTNTGGTITDLNRITWGHTGTPTNCPTSTGYQYYDDLAAFGSTWWGSSVVTDAISPATSIHAFATVSGILGVRRKLASLTISATSTVVGTVFVKPRLGGTVNATSAVGGTLRVPGQTSIPSTYGTAVYGQAVYGGSGAPPPTGIAGQIAAISTVGGGVTRIPVSGGGGGGGGGVYTPPYTPPTPPVDTQVGTFGSFAAAVYDLLNVDGLTS